MIWAVIGMAMLHAAELPAGPTPEPVAFPHFPTRLHAYVWLNWPLVPVERIAKTVGATPDAITALAKRMGLPDPEPIPDAQIRRSYITVIRRNWHLLPYEQLLDLLGWTPQQLAYTLREDDFLYIKLGLLKPKCAPLHFEESSTEVRAREEAMAATVRRYFPDGLDTGGEPLFAFVADLSSMPPERPAPDSAFSPRFCSSYFALYGDPFMEPELDGYPEGYLERLRQAGVNGVWLHAVLYKMTPFPWDPSLSEGYETRLKNLAALVERAQRHGIGVYLYFNEPRAMPLPFFEQHPELKGVVEGDHAALCVSTPAVQEYLRNGVAAICQAVPGLAGFFTITASENFTHCWSHSQGAQCPRCKEAGPEVTVALSNRLVSEGIVKAGAQTALIAWDWGWADAWAPGIIERLPEKAALMSVSEWSIPLERGGVKTAVGEYSLSVVGPGPRATRHWALARERGLKTLAKVQAGNTWELSAVPFLPVLDNVARHATGIRAAGVQGIMLGWTLGGYPSPNLEVYAEAGRPEIQTPDAILRAVAARRYGDAAAPGAVEAWRAFSAAFQEFPYNGGVLYNAPIQMGPANPLWEAPTGYHATMVGLPYDALDDWRGPFPSEVFQGQFDKMAHGFEEALTAWRSASSPSGSDPEQARVWSRDQALAEVCAIHFSSVADQAGFVRHRNALGAAKNAQEAGPHLAELERILDAELKRATRLYALQQADSRIGFECSNHYFYVPIDLAAKTLNIHDLQIRWLPEQKKKWMP